MSEVFANTIDGMPILAERSKADKNGVPLTRYLNPSSVGTETAMLIASATESDETILFDQPAQAADGSWSSISLSESPLNFEYVDVYYGVGTTNSGNAGYDYVRFRPSDTPATILENFFASNIASAVSSVYAAYAVVTGTDTVTWTKVGQGIHSVTSTSIDNTRTFTYIVRVVGIHRIAGG